METIAGGSSEELRVNMNAVTSGGEAFKKLITDTGEHHIRSSAHAVVSNDDLLIEILLRLPVLSLSLFKIVSKRWSSLIKSPNFVLRRTKIPNLDPPCGLFIQRGICPFEHNFSPLDDRIPANRTPFSTNSFTVESDAANVEILQSCNGLFLCGIRPGKLYVYNPSINRLKLLPQVSISTLGTRLGFMKLAFDPTKSPHYIVVYPSLIHDNIHGSAIQIQTYSSETCNWSVCDDRFDTHCFDGFRNGIYWNDAIHWLDDKGALHYKLDVNRLFLTSNQTPVPLDNRLHFGHMLFESCGCLLFVCVVSTRYEQRLNVYEMRNGSPDWSVKYLVDVNNIMTIFQETWKMSGDIFKWFGFQVLCIVLGKKEEDSFLVMKMNGKIVQYKIVLNTLSMLYDMGPNYVFDVDKPDRLRSFPFIASFSSV